MPFKNEDAKRFAELITALAVTFGKEADQPMFVGYEMALDDLALDDISRAVRRAIRECRFMPSGRELRDLAGAAAPDLKPDSRALIAYSTAAKACRECGGYRSVDFEDRIINAAIRAMGGWERFCDWPTDEVQWRQRDFERHYQAYSQAGVNAELTAPLAGFVEKTNGANGHQLPVVHEIEVDLPRHRQGLIRGTAPARRIECEPVKSAVGSLVKSLGVDAALAPVQRHELSEDEFARRKAEGIRRLRELKQQNESAAI